MPNPPVLAELDSKLTTVGKPAEGGCCYTSFSESLTFPSDAVTKMSTLAGWESLGELAPDPFSESKSLTTSELKGWHNTTQQVGDGDESLKVKAAFVEINRPSVAKIRYGSGNVVAGADGSVAEIKGKFGVNCVIPLLFDELESEGFLRRTLYRKVRVTGFDDIAHKRGELLVYGLEFTILDPGNGVDPFSIWRAKPASV